MEVIPSFLAFTSVQELERYDGQAFGNYLLRPGEVKKVIYPEDPGNLSGFIEYDVWVQHRENNTAVSLIYHNCLSNNPLAGLADHFVMTYRTDPKAGVTKNSQQSIVDGVGSKVLLLCINGERASARIVGGIRDSRSNDRGRKAKGHHLEFEFNGVRFEIGDAGGLRVSVNGKTAADGTLDPKADKAGVGTYLEIGANGTWTAATKDGKQSVVIDHKAGTIKVNAEKRLTLTSDAIDIGDGADQAAVCGDELVEVLSDILDEIVAQKFINGAGTTGPPLNLAKFKAIRARLKGKILSQFIKVKKSKR